MFIIAYVYPSTSLIICIRARPMRRSTAQNKNLPSRKISCLWSFRVSDYTLSLFLIPPLLHTITNRAPSLHFVAFLPSLVCLRLKTANSNSSSSSSLNHHQEPRPANPLAIRRMMATPSVAPFSSKRVRASSYWTETHHVYMSLLWWLYNYIILLSYELLLLSNDVMKW